MSIRLRGDENPLDISPLLQAVRRWAGALRRLGGRADTGGGEGADPCLRPLSTSSAAGGARRREHAGCAATWPTRALLMVAEPQDPRAVAPMSRQNRPTPTRTAQW